MEEETIQETIIETIEKSTGESTEEVIIEEFKNENEEVTVIEYKIELNENDGQSKKNVVISDQPTSYLDNVYNENAKPIENYLEWSIVSNALFICGGLIVLVCSIPALIFSIKIRKFEKLRDHENAKKYSKYTFILNIIATVLIAIGIISAIVGLCIGIDYYNNKSLKENLTKNVSINDISRTDGIKISKTNYSINISNNTLNGNVSIDDVSRVDGIKILKTNYSINISNNTLNGNVSIDDIIQSKELTSTLENNQNFTILDSLTTVTSLNQNQTKTKKTKIIYIDPNTNRTVRPPVILTRKSSD